MEQVLAASPQPDVKELLHGLQLTIEFEAQLTKRYEKLVNNLHIFIFIFFWFNSYGLSTFNKKYVN